MCKRLRMNMAKMARCQKGTRDGQGGQDGHRRRALDHLAQTPKAFIFNGLRIKMVKIAKMVTYLSGTVARLKMVIAGLAMTILRNAESLNLQGVADQDGQDGQAPLPLIAAVGIEFCPHSGSPRKIERRG